MRKERGRGREGATKALQVVEGGGNIGYYALSLYYSPLEAIFLSSFLLFIGRPYL